MFGSQPSFIMKLTYLFSLHFAVVLVLLLSTSTPGTCESLKTAESDNEKLFPDFLPKNAKKSSEEIAKTDFSNFGGEIDDEDIKERKAVERLKKIYRNFKYFYEGLLKEQSEGDEEMEKSHPGITKSIIDAPNGSKCPPGQRPDGHGRCRVPL